MPAAKKKITGELSTGGLNRPMKMVKMILAKCNVCNPRGQGPRGWWETCEHDPYSSMQPMGPPKPIFEELEDGTYKQVGVEELRWTKKLNLIQIADDVKVSSGRQVQIQLERGSKFPEDLGYAPLCDYNNCWESNPKHLARQIIEHEGVQTVVGKYHTRDEAAIMTLRTRGTPVYLGMDKDIQRRREQLEQVNVR
jgi:hypothetical protein